MICDIGLYNEDNLAAVSTVCSVRQIELSVMSLRINVSFMVDEFKLAIFE